VRLWAVRAKIVLAGFTTGGAWACSRLARHRVKKFRWAAGLFFRPKVGRRNIFTDTPYSISENNY
jgi:hypothetical protein